MLHIFDSLRDFTFFNVLFRLILAAILGGSIGLERERKKRPAGMRTYMIVCVGAALTMILSQYETLLLDGMWASQAAAIGLKIDASRLGAQVINGIGFLGAGTILVSGHQEVKGLTTAVALWASGCMGVAIGAGFYECVFISYLAILASILILPVISNFFVENAKNMNIYVEFNDFADLKNIVRCIRLSGATIYEVELNRGHKKKSMCPSAILLLHLNEHKNHADVISHISVLECVNLIEEI